MSAESGDDESLNKNKTTCFVKRTITCRIQQVEKAYSDNGDVLFMLSLKSSRTLRSKIASDGGIQQCGSRLRFSIFLSSPSLLRRSHQMSFVLDQDWISWAHAAILILCFQDLCHRVSHRAGCRQHIDRPK